MSLDLLLTPNIWLGPWYLSTLYTDNIDSTNFNGTLNIGVAKIGSLGRINIGAVGVPVYIDDVLFNPVVGGGYTAVVPIAATDNNGIIVDNTTANIKMELADDTHSGILSVASQSIAGFKTFTTGLTSPLDSTTHNVFFGTGTGNLTVFGSKNFGYGYQCLTSLTNGSNNIGIGSNALDAVTLGNQNIGIGNDSLGALTSGTNNIAIGRNIITTATSCTSNLIIGNDTCPITTGGSNVIVGGGSLTNATTCNNNIAIGRQTLTSITSGGDNIAIGVQAGSNLTGNDGSNILIGSNGVAGDFRVIRIGGTSMGDVSCFIQGISGVATGGAAVACLVDASGQLGTISSERKLKENIEPLKDVKDIIKNLKPCSFNMISDESKAKTIGFIADEFEQVAPEYVVTQANGIRTIQYHLLSTLYLKEIQRLQNVVESLQTQINEINYRMQANNI